MNLDELNKTIRDIGGLCVLFLFVFIVIVPFFKLVMYAVEQQKKGEQTATTTQRTVTEETEQEVNEAKLVSEDYACQEIGGTSYLSLNIQDSDDEAPVIIIAGALTEIKKKYEIGQVITIDRRTFLVEITKEKPPQSSPHP